MAEFAWNNAKNTSTSYILFELNLSYYPKVLFENDDDLCSRSRFAEKLAKKLRELIEICYQNLLYT